MDIRAFGGFHTVDEYASVAPEKQLEVLIDGFKIMSCPSMRAYCGIGLNDPYYEKMFVLLEEAGFHVNIHVAVPEEFWDDGRQYDDPRFPTKEQLYDEVLQVLDRHPRLKAVFAHFFFLSNMPDEAVRILEKYPNVYFELTPGVEMYLNFDENLGFWQIFMLNTAIGYFSEWSKCQ